MRTRVSVLVFLLAAVVLAPAVTAASTGSLQASTTASGQGDAPVQGALPVVGTQVGTTNRLSLPATDVQTSTVGNASLDVAGAIGTGADAAGGEFATRRLEAAFEAAGTPAARRTVLLRSHDRVEARIETLAARERDALAAYNAGDLTTHGYLTRLGRVHAAATRLEVTVERLGEYANSVPDSPVTDDDIARLRADLLPLSGPVRESTVRALAGEDPPMRAYVKTSSSGVVLATLGGTLGQEYVRTAYLASARTPNQPDQFTQHEDHPFTVARDRAGELYPWAFENRLSLSIGDPVLYRAGVYPVVIDHEQGVSRRGDLVTYLDGATTEAFLEHQYKNTAKLPTTPLGTNESETLRLQVNRTHSGGPLSVLVTTHNGTAVDASVTVNGVDVGQTGPDGGLWTIAPDGRLSVNATARGERVTLTRGTPTPSGG